MDYLLILINAERFNVTKDSADAIANATTSVVEVTLTGKEMLRMWIPVTSIAYVREKGKDALAAGSA